MALTVGPQKQLHKYQGQEMEQNRGSEHHQLNVDSCQEKVSNLCTQIALSILEVSPIP